MPEVGIVSDKAAHACTPDEIYSRFQTVPEFGLTSEFVQQHRQRFGLNQLSEVPPVEIWRRFLMQFADLVIWILIGAAVLSGFLGEWVDSLAIIAIVLLNGTIGFFQEERAERAISALQKMSAPTAKVMRGGSLTTIPAVELVPGDLIEIEAGDHVPADARLIETYGMSVEEAALTGESTPSEKQAHILLPTDAPLGDRQNMMYLGTVVGAGKGRAVVVATGMNTELGRIAGLLERPRREPTPLQRRLSQLGQVLIVVCLILVAAIFTLQVLRGGQIMDALMVSVSLAVAAVPEGLPAVVTVALALGLQRMVKRNALVRKLPSVETLGSVSIICTDKTGTLTRNEMTVQEIVAGGAHFAVSGVGYIPEGLFLRREGTQVTENTAVPLTDLKDVPALSRLLFIGAACSTARLQPPTDEVPTWHVLGDATEGALLVAALKGKCDPAAARQRVIHEFPFDASRKAMSVVVKMESGEQQLLCKGAPEVILSHCIAEDLGSGPIPLTVKRRQELLAENSRMAGHALRVLGIAYRPHVPATLLSGIEMEVDLVFVGLLGMIDPPREEARRAIGTCKAAGIHPVMITGDHQATAMAIAGQLGLIRAGDQCLSGPELDKVSDDSLKEQVPRIAVFARATAAHKLRIVQAWKARGEIVAMTGDGVNDAPAIQAADIGIAMGITGTDVTRQASDMILMDDNFASIVNAVEEGRGIFENIQKVLQFLLSCNLGEILLMLGASLLGWPVPLLPIQLLWINLVTDGLPALALSLEPPEKGIMQRPPRPSRESILSQRIGFGILFQGMLLAGVGLTAFGLAFHSWGFDTHRARSLTFCVVVYAELFRALAARSQTSTFWSLGPLSNPALLLAVIASGLLQFGIAVVPFTQDIFDLPAHTVSEWTWIVLLALTPVTVIELSKLMSSVIPKQPGELSPLESDHV